MRPKHVVGSVVVAGLAAGLGILDRIWPDDDDVARDDDGDFDVCGCCGRPWPRERDETE